MRGVEFSLLLLARFLGLALLPFLALGAVVMRDALGDGE